MTHLYEATATVSIKVEADNVEEARREARKLVNEVRGVLPTGVSLRVSEHHQSREIHVSRI